MKKYVIAGLCLLMIGLAACSKEKESEPTGKAGTAPLTGEKTSHADARAVAVMVNNHTKARPQTGLSKADLVFEVLAESDITRFLAIYQSEKPNEVGPVRSAREYYVKLAEGYNALYVYHGAAKFVDQFIADEGIDYINGAQHDNDGKLFVRSTDRKAPHNSYLQFGAITAEAKKQGYAVTAADKPLPFAKANSKVEGEPASNIKIQYSSNDAYNPEFRYNDKDSTYERWTDNVQTVDADGDQPIAVKNLFVIEAHHEVFDKEGRRKIDLTAGGDAYLFQQGKVQKLQWKQEDGRILPYRDGKVVTFLPGKTWINIVPDDPGLGTSVTTAND